MRLWIKNEGMEQHHGLKKLFWLVVQNLFELVCLNVFFLISCIPIVTIPLAVSALTKTLMDLINDIGSKPLIAYWKAVFHSNWRQYGTIAPIIAVEALLCYGLLIYMGARNAGALFWLGCGMEAAVLSMLFILQFYAGPLVISTDLRPTEVWKKAALLAAAKLPYSLAAFAAIAVVWILCIRYFQSAWIAFVLIVFSYTYLIGTFCANSWVQAYFVKPEEKDGEEDDKACTG